MTAEQAAQDGFMKFAPLAYRCSFCFCIPTFTVGPLLVQFFFYFKKRSSAPKLHKNAEHWYNLAWRKPNMNSMFALLQLKLQLSTANVVTNHNFWGDPQKWSLGEKKKKMKEVVPCDFKQKSINSPWNLLEFFGPNQLLQCYSGTICK